MKTSIWIKAAITAITMIGTGPVFAQGYLDQEGMESLSQTQDGPVDDVKKVEWRVYEYKDHIKNDNKGVWSEFLSYIDTIPGSYHDRRRLIVEIANRITGENFKVGSKLLIPSSFPMDFRAYSPYPFRYDAAAKMPKLVIIDKYTQTFAAYENGDLIRWGLVCTGHSDDLTPAGRYNINWKAEYKQSSEAPEGQVWEMYWVANLDPKSGIHMHQYALPISRPSSHGCVRMSMGDAKWNYDWSNGWEQKNGKIVKNGTPVVIINSIPASGRASQWDVSSDEEVSSAVNLPDDLSSMPAPDGQQFMAWQSGR